MTLKKQVVKKLVKLQYVLAHKKLKKIMVAGLGPKKELESLNNKENKSNMIYYHNE